MTVERICVSRISQREGRGGGHALHTKQMKRLNQRGIAQIHPEYATGYADEEGGNDAWLWQRLLSPSI